MEDIYYRELTKKDVRQLLDSGELEFYFEDYDSAVRAMEEFQPESYKVDDVLRKTKSGYEFGSIEYSDDDMFFISYGYYESLTEE